MDSIKFELYQFYRCSLVIWPEHCIMGTFGHCVVDEINEALQEWAKVTHREVHYILKGQNPYTGTALLSACFFSMTVALIGFFKRLEMYSAFAAEIQDPADKRTHLNTEVTCSPRPLCVL